MAFEHPKLREIVARAVSDAAQRAARAGTHDHAAGQKRPAGQRRHEVLVMMIVKLVGEVVIWLLLFTVRLSVAAEHYCRRGQIAIAIIPDALAPTGRTGSPLRLCCRHAVQRIVREVLGPIRVQIIGNGYNFAVVVRSVTLREVLHGSVG